MPTDLLTRTEVPFVSRLDEIVERPALITADRTLSYGELAHQVSEAGRQLGTARRLVMIVGSNTVGCVVAYLAALRGRHPVLLVPGGHDDHVNALIARYDPDVVVTGTGDDWHLDERRPVSAHDLHPELALLLTTSGSTGAPKLVRLSWTNLRSNADAIAEYLRIVESDRAITTLPLHYCYGLSVLNSHLTRGAAIVLTELSVVDACFWDLFRAAGATTFAGVPYTFDQLDRVGFDAMALPTLRYVTQAGGKLAPNQVKRYAELGRRQGWQLVVMYGQTEATARMAYLPPHLATTHPEAIGVPVPGGSFALVPVPEAEPGVGELVYSGPNVMLGYAESPADLALGRTADVLHTGDLARQVDGVYEIVGRRSRLAKIYGLRIDLEHVERTLAGQRVTAWCADGGDHLVVAVTGRPGVDVAALIHQQLGLPRSAVRVHPVDEPPRLPSGKVDYRAIGALGSTDRTTDVAPPPAPTMPGGDDVTADRLRDLYARLLNRTDVTDESTFVGLGGDSLSYVETSIHLERILGTLPPNWHVTAIRDLTPRRRRWSSWRQVEITVVLRAAAIVAIVGTHAELFTLRGGAHALMALAGFNLARFHLTATATGQRARRILAGVGRIVVPSVAWIAAVAILAGTYALPTVVLLNSVLGPPGWSTQRHFWFIESLVYLLLTTTALLAVPALARAERRWPFGFPIAVVGLGLLTRYEIVAVGESPQIGDAHMIAWLFALGWAGARAGRTAQRLLVSAVTLATVPGFFEDAARTAVTVGAIVLMVWVRTVPLPRALARLSAVLASASLYIYLTHWQVYPWIFGHSPLVAVTVSMVTGVVYWKLSTATFAAAGTLLARRHDRASAA